MKPTDFVIDESDSFADTIINCRRCPRLIKHCRAVAEKKIMRRSAFADEIYWGRPVPNFGKLPARLLIVGLAPGAHGANRTSRMFTGDDSGLWLYRALFDSGFATTPGASTVGDNRLIDCSITAVIHCAPPGNQPEPNEVANCEPFLIDTIKASRPKVILALGQLAWTRSLVAIEKIYGVSLGRGKERPKFAHGARIEASSSIPVTVLSSFHVSRQNTNTGRLTRPMLDQVFAAARKAVDN